MRRPNEGPCDCAMIATWRKAFAFAQRYLLTATRWLPNPRHWARLPGFPSHDEILSNSDETKSSYDKLLYWTLGIVETRAQAVNCGERPVAEVTVQDVYLQEAIKAAENEGLQTIQIELGEHHTNLYMFKHPHLRHVIVQMHAFAEARPNLTELEDWMWGKLFGYGEHEIGEYISAGPAVQKTPLQHFL